MKVCRWVDYQNQALKRTWVFIHWGRRKERGNILTTCGTLLCISEIPRHPLQGSGGLRENIGIEWMEQSSQASKLYFRRSPFCLASFHFLTKVDHGRPFKVSAMTCFDVNAIASFILFSSKNFNLPTFRPSSAVSLVERG